MANNLISLFYSLPHYSKGKKEKKNKTVNWKEMKTGRFGKKINEFPCC